MGKLFTIAIAFGTLVGLGGTVHAQDAKLVEKCRAQVRKVMPDVSSPGNKQQATILMRKCMSNKGKL